MHIDQVKFCSTLFYSELRSSKFQTKMTGLGGDVLVEDIVIFLQWRTFAV